MSVPAAYCVRMPMPYFMTLISARSPPFDAPHHTPWLTRGKTSSDSICMESMETR